MGERSVYRSSWPRSGEGYFPMSCSPICSGRAGAGPSVSGSAIAVVMKLQALKCAPTVRRLSDCAAMCTGRPLRVWQ